MGRKSRADLKVREIINSASFLGRGVDLFLNERYNFTKRHMDILRDNNCKVRYFENCEWKIQY